MLHEACPSRQAHWLSREEVLQEVDKEAGLPGSIRISEDLLAWGYEGSLVQLANQRLVSEPEARLQCSNEPELWILSTTGDVQGGCWSLIGL